MAARRKSSARQAVRTKSPLEWDNEELALVEALAREEARKSFWAYRQYMHPKLKMGWWHRVIANEFQAFYDDWMAGKRPIMLLMSPPQHGKSMNVEDFASWVPGRVPDVKEIYASYSDDLGIRTNMTLQRAMDEEKYRLLFPDAQLNSSNVVTLAGRALRNSSILEFINSRGRATGGFFRNTTVEGQITGQGLSLGFIDDPIKGRAEAMSKTKRDKAWNWLTDDFMTRFTEEAGFIMTMTRWHVDDPGGRLLEKYGDAREGGRVRIIRYPAIAEKNEMFRDKGEALFPEHKSLEFLLERKSGMSQASWESLYQQNPIIVGGGMFPIEKFEIITGKPNPKEVRKTIRYWDKAATEDGGAYTCGVRMHIMKNGQFVISDVRRGQWSALDRERRMRQTAEMDHAEYQPVHIWVEQEPGSGGKESAQRSIMNLRGFICKADPVRGAKEIRAEPYAAQVQGGNVLLCAAEWNVDFIDEHETFPTGKYKDQVDAAGGAFAKLAISGSTYDSSLSWVG